MTETRLQPLRVEEIVEDYNSAIRGRQGARDFFARHNCEMFHAMTDGGDAISALVPAGPKEESFEVPFWGISVDRDNWWAFPGLEQYAARSSFAAGGWHGAKERFNGLYELIAGPGFLRRAAKVARRGGKLICDEPGTIELARE